MFNFPTNLKGQIFKRNSACTRVLCEAKGTVGTQATQPAGLNQIRRECNAGNPLTSIITHIPVVRVKSISSWGVKSMNYACVGCVR